MSNSKTNEIHLSFLPTNRVEEGLQKVGMIGDINEFVTPVEDLKEWFKGYEIDTIELFIEGAVKAGNVTKLFVSPEGKGGMRVILKPT